MLWMIWRLFATGVATLFTTLINQLTYLPVLWSGQRRRRTPKEWHRVMWILADACVDAARRLMTELLALRREALQGRA